MIYFKHKKKTLSTARSKLSPTIRITQGCSYYGDLQTLMNMNTERLKKHSGERKEVVSEEEEVGNNMKKKRSSGGGADLELLKGEEKNSFQQGAGSPATNRRHDGPNN